MKWKNYGLWVALGSLVVMLANDAFNVAPSVSEPYVDAVLTILIAGGIISNPSKTKGFKDKRKRVK
ncbi:holin [Virgibacillus sp. FSP13]